MYCPPKTAVIWFIKLFNFGLTGIKLEETISMMMGIKQITWITNRKHFLPDTLRKKQLLLTQSTSHLFYGKSLKHILEIKLLVLWGKHKNNECHSPSIRVWRFQSENRDLLLVYISICIPIFLRKSFIHRVASYQDRGKHSSQSSSGGRSLRYFT